MCFLPTHLANFSRNEGFVWHADIIYYQYYAVHDNERERERTKEVGRERERGRKQESARKRKRERDTLHNYVDDPYELGTRCSTHSADGHFRLPPPITKALSTLLLFISRHSNIGVLTEIHAPGKISIFNVKVKEHRWFWRWRNEPPVTLKGKFTLSYFVSCFPSREYETRLIRGGLRKDVLTPAILKWIVNNVI